MVPRFHPCGRYIQAKCFRNNKLANMDRMAWMAGLAKLARPCPYPFIPARRAGSIPTGRNLEFKDYIV
jgi:hypothetical protein